MQPTRASNETSLPRAVVRRSAAIAARYAPPEVPNPAETAAPATEPAAEPATPEAPPAPPGEPTDPRASDPAYWRQRFNSTAGVLAKERTDRVTAETRLKQQVAELQDANRSLEASKPVPETAIDLSEFYSPAEIEQYGEEQCKVMVRSAMRAAAKAVKPPPAEVRPAPEPTAAPPSRAEQADPGIAAFVEQLTELVPEYREWDQDPRWLAWLVEETNDVQRQALLNVHIGNRDAKKVAKMFNDWDRSVAVPAPPVSPSGSGAAPSSEAVREVPSGLTYPTQAEIKDHFKRAAVVKKGQPGYVTDEERVKFEARLALRHGNR